MHRKKKNRYMRSRGCAEPSLEERGPFFFFFYIYLIFVFKQAQAPRYVPSVSESQILMSIAPFMYYNYVER